VQNCSERCPHALGELLLVCASGHPGVGVPVIVLVGSICRMKEVGPPLVVDCDGCVMADGSDEVPDNEGFELRRMP
jgi:hypothetical protein